LRAPLRGINGYTQILLDDYALQMDDEGKKVCTIIHESSQKMGKLIDNLLEFSHLNRTHLQKSHIDTRAMLESIYLEITDLQSQGRIKLEIGEMCDVHADPTMIKQVWSNLLSNAIKYSSKRSRPMISISCKTVNDRYVFCIKDNGAGFNMKYRDKLFNVFERLHSVKDFEGTGVGLAIVQRIILRHGGEVWAEGEVDKGVSFYFSLPLASAGGLNPE
jgi:light-regulated signal transduction histidine kinase (bacteriophytochrome)